MIRKYVYKMRTAPPSASASTPEEYFEKLKGTGILTKDFSLTVKIGIEIHEDVFENINPDNYNYNANPEHQEWLEMLKESLKHFKKIEDEGGQKIDTIYLSTFEIMEVDGKLIYV